MKLKIISSGNQSMVKCFLRPNSNSDIFIGSKSCSSCMYNRKATLTYVDCSKADTIMRSLSDLKFKNPTTYTTSSEELFKYKNSTGETKSISSIEDLVVCYESFYLEEYPTGNVNDFLNKSRRVRKKNPDPIFSIGKTYDSFYNLRRFLFDRDLLKSFLDIISKQTF